jgi:predicted CDP-diglyceride synthetase/phosphatidate cytidylyltransferase
MVAKYRSILVAGKRKKIMKEKKREVVFDLRIWWNRVVLIEMESELPQKNRTILFNSIIF